MERPPSPWCNANRVGRPLIRFLEGRRNDGENFREWILKLRALNKSWYLEMTSHIQKTLSLAEVTETEFDELIPMTSVKNLSINQTSLAIVEKCPNLENLTIVDCSLMKNEHFKCNPQLRTLFIDSSEGFRCLSLDESFLNGLASLTELTQLRISQPHFGKYVESSRVLSLEEQLLSLQSMRHCLNDELKHGFLSSLPPLLRELELWGLLSWTDNQLLMEKTTSLNSLEKLALGNGEGRVGYDDLEWLTKLPNLVELGLWGREVVSQGLVRLTEIPMLRRLALGVINIKPQAFQQLCLVGDSVQQILICCQGLLDLALTCKFTDL
ncbi:hypothetical protein BSKO_12631 [Bryopsis sp. KO-2023]|nr:hypothetical protein BSKO_12631 [Bryopsis sp. KO-2023]